MGIDRFYKYESMLQPEDASRGANFHTDFPGLFDLVLNRYPLERHAAVYSNMLRSEHVPLNFFGPLKLLKHGEKVVRFVKRLVELPDVREVKAIEIEWSPRPRERYLDDYTSFDAYIVCQSDQEKLYGIGVEVKYTEKMGRYDTKERRRMFEEYETSPYAAVSSQSGLYVSEAQKSLREKELKQTWRNHILGESMVLRGELEGFISVLLFPNGNDHQRAISIEYKTLLRPEKQSRFRAMTYEEFIRLGRDVFEGERQMVVWLDYLEKRYIPS